LISCQEEDKVFWGWLLYYSEMERQPHYTCQIHKDGYVLTV